MDILTEGNGGKVTRRQREEGRRREFILLLTEVAHHSPVGLWYCKPFTVSWSDVDVDRTEVIVFLVT